MFSCVSLHQRLHWSHFVVSFSYDTYCRNVFKWRVLMCICLLMDSVLLIQHCSRQLSHGANIWHLSSDTYRRNVLKLYNAAIILCCPRLFLPIPHRFVSFHQTLYSPECQPYPLTPIIAMCSNCTSRHLSFGVLVYFCPPWSSCHAIDRPISDALNVCRLTCAAAVCSWSVHWQY